MLKLFFAGNFPQMHFTYREYAKRKLIIERMGEYNRLVSYYWMEGWSEHVVAMKKEELEHGIQTYNGNKERLRDKNK